MTDYSLPSLHLCSASSWSFCTCAESFKIVGSQIISLPKASRLTWYEFRARYVIMVNFIPRLNWKSSNVFKDFSAEKKSQEFWYQIWLKFLKSPLSFIDLKIIAGKQGLVPFRARSYLIFEYSYLEKDCRKKMWTRQSRKVIWDLTL